jgi:hypothetical protein
MSAPHPRAGQRCGGLVVDNEGIWREAPQSQPKSENLATFQAALDELARNAGDAALAKACERIDAEIGAANSSGAGYAYVRGLERALELLINPEASPPEQPHLPRYVVTIADGSPSFNCHDLTVTALTAADAVTQASLNLSQGARVYAVRPARPEE